MERQTKLRRKIAAERKVAIGFRATQPMVQMRCVQHEPQFPAPFNKSAQQCNRISPARQPDCKTHPRLQQRCV
jgi:hypothetical protein